jgi:hypothetical protein
MNKITNNNKAKNPPKKTSKRVYRSNADLWFFTFSIISGTLDLIMWIFVLTRAERSIVKVPMTLNANGTFVEQPWWMIYIITSIITVAFVSLLVFAYGFRRQDDTLLADGFIIMTILVQIFSFAVLYNITSLSV